MQVGPMICYTDEYLKLIIEELKEHNISLTLRAAEIIQFLLDHNDIFNPNSVKPRLCSNGSN